ncbi:MAG TPA: glycosyltransferase family A protein [Candidatus Dormibacteraeota bacterium]|nr:glycosyltransferase family A protein [Candidatus Dormibacteraeota bacterium]
MTTRPDVSVLICTRDRSALLENCLDSVLACSPAPAEVVIVDQSGDQATRKAVDGRQGRKVPVRYIRGIGTGLSRAKNQGIPECAGAIIAFTDDDCLADTRWVEALTGPIISGRAGAVVGRTLPEKGVAGREDTTSVYSPEGCPVFSRRTHPWRVGGGGNFAAARDVLRLSGPFDERFGPGAALESAEDMDMIHRILRAGERIVYAPDAVIRHRSWRSSSQNRRLSRAYGIGAGGYFAKHVLAGDWISGWRFVARLGIRTVHLSRAILRADRRGIAEQGIYLVALFEGAGRFLLGGGPAPERVADLERREEARS